MLLACTAAATAELSELNS